MADVDGIAAALDVELVENSEITDSRDHLEKLRGVVDTLADIYSGVKEATDTGRSVTKDGSVVRRPGGPR